MSNFWISASFNTALVSIGVLVFSLGLALPIAWLVERSDLIGKKHLSRLFTLPYIVPSYLLAIAWITLANPDVGWLNLILKNFFGVERFFNIYGIGGVIFIEGIALSSILFLSLRAAFSRIDPGLEEAALLCGAGRLKIFTQITLPLIKQSLLLGLVSVFLATVASFGVPAMIGTPGRTFVLTTGIYSLFQNGTRDAFQEAFNISVLVSLATLVIVFLSRTLLGDEKQIAQGRSSGSRIQKLHKLRFPISFLVWVIFISLVLLPILTIFFSSLQSDPADFTFRTLSFASWSHVLQLDEFRTSIHNSLLASALSSSVILIFGLGFSLLSWRVQLGRSKKYFFFLRLVEEVSFALYSLPGTVLALLLIIGVRKAGLFSLADSIYILSLAYSLKYFSLGLSTLRPGTRSIHASLIEAAELSGAQKWQRLVYIWLPLLKNFLVASLILVFMPAIGELTMSKLLAAPASQNLGIFIFDLHDYADRRSASVVACMLIIAVFSLQWIAEGVSKKNA